jgi:hypothetical protein
MTVQSEVDKNPLTVKDTGERVNGPCRIVLDHLSLAAKGRFVLAGAGGARDLAGETFEYLTHSG